MHLSPTPAFTTEMKQTASALLHFRDHQHCTRMLSDRSRNAAQVSSRIIPQPCRKSGKWFQEEARLATTGTEQGR